MGISDQSINSVSAIVKQTIEEVTGNTSNDVHDDADLIEDLGMSRIELSKMITTVTNKLEVELSDYARQDLLLAETVGDVIDIFEEEYEF